MLVFLEGCYGISMFRRYVPSSSMQAISISALHRLDMHQRFLRIYILTASAPECLCCAVLCEMVAMDRSTAPSQFSIATDSHVAFPNHLSVSSASASAHCSGSDLLKWQQAESTLGEAQYGHACTPPHPPKTMNAEDGGACHSADSREVPANLAQ